ncbi:hypothetical protein CHU95_00450 [Niveispirillum lacus]|uniref:HTH tetR-type domain-containing protein n=1 Tax=Niveispirillum lacus TaxID=1981099 RepID=A0A255ZAC2_9PROT|nr:helix-turn-helix domain-containing protein [Niveispirillum lacus]OYQ37815.1 hypothetical protein CHU95_00450 [Niveispirillum lacus]
MDAAARQARTDHILAAARRCFARHGFHGAGTADICRDAGISPASLYQYFASKDDLILAIVGGTAPMIWRCWRPLTAWMQPWNSI